MAMQIKFQITRIAKKNIKISIGVQLSLSTSVNAPREGPRDGGLRGPQLQGARGGQYRREAVSRPQPCRSGRSKPNTGMRKKTDAECLHKKKNQSNWIANVSILKMATSIIDFSFNT